MPHAPLPFAHDAPDAVFPARIERRAGQGGDAPLVLCCEHASNAIPPAWGDLGLSPDARRAHIAWDIGGLDLARGLLARLGGALVHAPVSRLVYDLNRAPDQAGAMPAKSEVFDIPANAKLSEAERQHRTRAIYLPFHDALRAEIADHLAKGQTPILVTVHSFTPVYFGAPRAVEFGVIHDADDRLARAVLAHAPKGLDTRLNEPYSAADHVTHTLRLQATPYGLPNVMLEIRNDLIATPASAEAMAVRIAPCLAAAFHDLGLWHTSDCPVTAS